MLKIGSHIPFKSPNYLPESVKISIENGANTMMIYLGPPQSTLRTDVQKWKLEEYNKNWNAHIKPIDIIVHAPYIVNLANFDKYQFSKEFLIKEIERMNIIGAKYLVLHPGSSLKQDVNQTLIHLSNEIKDIIDKTKDVCIVLETMAGKGTEVGTNFEQLRFLIDSINNDRVGICIDTCHLWDSGFDLKTDFEKNSGQNLYSILKEYKLLEKVKVIHLNDSKNECNSHKDRHENIGHGKIGLQALKNFANHSMFNNIPIILETPWIDNQMPYKKEIELIKKE